MDDGAGIALDRKGGGRSENGGFLPSSCECSRCGRGEGRRLKADCSQRNARRKQ